MPRQRNDGFRQVEERGSDLHPVEMVSRGVGSVARHRNSAAPAPHLIDVPYGSPMSPLASAAGTASVVHGERHDREECRYTPSTGCFY